MMHTCTIATAHAASHAATEAACATPGCTESCAADPAAAAGCPRTACQRCHRLAWCRGSTLARTRCMAAVCEHAGKKASATACNAGAHQGHGQGEDCSALGETLTKRPPCRALLLLLLLLLLLGCTDHLDVDDAIWCNIDNAGVFPVEAHVKLLHILPLHCSSAGELLPSLPECCRLPELRQCAWPQSHSGCLFPKCRWHCLLHLCM